MADAADHHDTGAVSGFHPLWLDITDPLTGESVTLDVADAPTVGAGETLVIEWTSDGFLLLPRVERPSA